MTLERKKKPSRWVASFCYVSDFPDQNSAGTFHDSIAGNDLTHAVHHDLAGTDILDGVHMAVDGGMDIGILEGKIGILPGAVFQLQILAERIHR